jgi:hypothetical protein
MKRFSRCAMLALMVLTLSLMHAEISGTPLERPRSILGRGGGQAPPPGVLSLCKRPPCPAAPPAPSPIPVPTPPIR